MKTKLLAALALLPLLPLTYGIATAQNAPAGNVAAGKALWDQELRCKDCHGGLAEGAFGPDLAGRGLSAAQVKQAVRKPWGIMPTFTDEQVSELGPIDVLLVPVGGETTLSPAEAAEVVAQIGPKIVIPMHFGVDGASKDLQGPDKFLHEMATEPIRQPKAQVTVSSLPDETQVVVLEARGRTS